MREGIADCRMSIAELRNRRTRPWMVLLGLLALIPSGGESAEPRVGAELIASPEAGWPQFRGPRRDGVSDERGLLQSWPEGGPKELWSAMGAGKGFSSPIIAGGRIFITGDFGADTFVLAYDLAGKPLWRTQNGAAWLNQYQGARASVTVSEGRVYHENAHGRLVCLEAATGQELWAVSLLERFRGENIIWGLSECLVLDERAVYACAGGRDALVVALDKRTGEVLWRTPPIFAEDETGAAETATYSPPILARFAGKRLLIGCSARRLFCIDADSGEMQWTRPRLTSYSVLAMSPVLVNDGIFMTAPLGPPGEWCRLVAPVTPGGRIGVEAGWTTKLDTAQGGVVSADGRLYGSYYPKRGGWAALDAATGAVLYQAMDMLKGTSIYGDGRLYALLEDGWMQLLEPTAEKFEVRGRFRLATVRDRDAWAHPVILDGRLYLRYQDTVRCYDIRAGNP